MATAISTRNFATPRKVAPATPRKPGKDFNNKDPVEVYCRLRPLRNLTDAICVQKYNETTIKLTPITQVHKCVSLFSFRSVFPETTTQSEFFQKVGHPLLKGLIHGKNGLLFTYGTTSSGKTFTLTGKPNDCGILPRTLDILFNSLNGSLCRQFTFSPDGANGFKVRSAPDALLEYQKFKQVTRTPSATPVKRKVGADDDLKEWQSRDQDSTIIDLDSKGNGFSVFISYVEIYNNYIYDLLDDDIFSGNLEKKQPQSKVLREDKRKKVFVANAKEIEVISSDAAFNLFVKGVRRRRMAHTALNTESSRSHSVFNIKLVQSPLDADGEVIPDEKYVTVSQLALVDLAGSERTTRTKNTGERLREAGNINNSLLALRTCIELIRENQKYGTAKLIPYRDNKLTHLFKSYFEGEGKIKMVICVNPGASDFDETLHVMKFAETAQEVMINRADEIPFHLKMPHPYASPKFIPFPKGDSTSAITIGPPLPVFSSIDFTDKKQINDLIETLELRKKNVLRHFETIRSKQMLFRENLITAESEYMLTRQQLKITRNDLGVREEEVKKCEAKVNQLESELEEYLRKLYSCEKALREAEEKLDQKNQALNHADIKCELTKAATQEKIAREKERLKRVFEKVLREKQAQLEREQCLTKEKMHLVKEILSADNSDWGVFREYWDTMYPNMNPTTPNTGTKKTGFSYNNGSGGGFTHLRRPSIPDSIRTDSSAAATAEIKTSTPSSSKRLKLSSEPGTSMMSTPVIPTYEFTGESNDNENCLRTKSTPGIPVANPRHIRYLSTGTEKWIDHQLPSDGGKLDMGTVLRPKIKNKTSISNLQDIAPENLRRASKYAITSYTADEQGEIETRVHKGDIIPSTCGGAQVIFKDVETMIQSPPNK